MLPVSGVYLAGYKRMDLTLADRLFMAAIVNLPPERRPWGSITWLGDVFDTSRPTVYAIGERGRTGMQALPSRRPCLPALPAKRCPELIEGTSATAAHPVVSVTPNRIRRTILTLLFPGKVSGRDMEECLAAALDVGRSNATVSYLLHEAGRRDGESPLATPGDTRPARAHRGPCPDWCAPSSPHW